MVHQKTENLSINRLTTFSSFISPQSLPLSGDSVGSTMELEDIDLTKPVRNENDLYKEHRVPEAGDSVKTERVIKYNGDKCNVTVIRLL